MGKRRDIQALILNLCGRCRQMDSFMPHCCTTQYALNTRRPGGPQSQSEYSEEKKNLLPLPGIEPEIIQPVAWSLH
jgi:hypothetical protein